MNKNKIIKKTLPLFIAAALILTLCLGLAAPVSAEGEVCEIVRIPGVVVQQYYDLADALVAVQNSETIRLLDDIDYKTGIVIEDKNITFDLNGFVLNVEVESGNALEVNGWNNAEVRLINNIAGGEFNVISLSEGAGVYAVGNRIQVTVTSATGDDCGVYAGYDATVIVEGDVTGNDVGVYTDSRATVTVGGNITGNNKGVYAEEGPGTATITVSGNVISDNIGVYAEYPAIVVVDGDVSGDDIGVYAYGATVTIGGNVIGDNTGVYAHIATVTVGGDVTSNSIGVYSEYGRIIIGRTLSVDPSGVYIELYSGPKTKTDHELSSTKPGYFEYTDGDSIVWVRDPTDTDFVCKIVETNKQYTDLETAVALAKNGQTIKLLDDIDYGTGLSVSGKSITFDLDGFDLNIEVESKNALTVSNGGGVRLNDSAGGEFNVISLSDGIGLYVYNRSSVTVSNAFGDDYGVYSQNGWVTVSGNVTSNNIGLYAEGYDTPVTVGGDVIGGVYIGNRDIAGYYGYGYADEITVTVGGDVIDGVYIDGDDNEVTIEGNYDDIGDTSFIKPGYFEWTDGSNYIWWRDHTNTNYVCEIVETGKQYTYFGTAVALAGNDQTIRLLEDINYEYYLDDYGIEISSKSVTFDLNGFNLNIEAMDEALIVGSGEVLIDDSAGGEFNVAISPFGRYGMRAYNSSVTVTNVVGGDYGIFASNNSTVVVKGDVTGEWAGVHASNGSRVTIDGKITVYSEDEDDYIVLLNGTRFTFFSQADGVPSLTKPGYLEYTDGTNYVWVKEPVYVCEIVRNGYIMQQYSDFSDALSDVQSGWGGDIIRLLDDIDYNTDIFIDGKTIIVDVNGFVLNVEVESGNALKVVNGGEVRLINNIAGGEFNVISLSDGAGVYASGDRTNVTVTKAIGDEHGVYVEYDATVIVEGDVTGDDIGVYTDSRATVMVGGNVTGDNTGVYAEGFYGSAIITVNGNVISDNIGVYAEFSMVVTVDGDVTGNNFGVYSDGATVTVGGNVTGDNTGVYATTSDGTITVGGDVTSNNIGVYSEYGRIIIDGTLTVDPSGVYIELRSGPKEETNYEDTSTKLGYFEYTDGDSIIWVRDPSDTDTDFVCKIVETDKQYTDLETAVALAKNGQTIKLLDNIDHDTGLIVSGKSITFDVNSFVLNVEVEYGNALTVNSGAVWLNDSAGGEFNVISLFGGAGVYSTSRNSVTVSNAFGDEYGVYAQSGEVTVNGDVASNNTSVYTSVATVVVGGNVAGGDDYFPRTAGVYIDDFGATVTVGGDVIGAVGFAMYAQDGRVTIEGNYYDTGPASLIKPGYYEWTDGTNYVWWRDYTDPTYVCEIVDTGKQYTYFGTAVALAGNGQTIRLLDHIDFDAGDNGLEISGKSVTFDVNGYTLNVKTTSEDRQAALIVGNGGEVLLDDSEGGEFNVICLPDIPDGRSGYGIRIDKGNVTVTNVISDGYGLSAFSNSTVTIVGDVTSEWEMGVGGGSSVTVDGTITITGEDNTCIAVLFNGSNVIRYEIEEGVPSSIKLGYFEYTDGTNYVWMKDSDVLTYAIGFTTKDVTKNGVTATGTIKPTSQQMADAEITVTVKLTGTATDPGTHTVELTSATLGSGINNPVTATKAVTASEAMKTIDTFDFTFTMPANDVADLVVTHTFDATETPAIDYSGLQALINTAKALNEGDYTATSWADLQTAISNAEGMISGDTATDQQDVLNEIDALQLAIDSLVPETPATTGSGSSSGQATITTDNPNQTPDIPPETDLPEDNPDGNQTEGGDGSGGSGGSGGSQNGGTGVQNIRTIAIVAGVIVVVAGAAAYLLNGKKFWK